MNIQMSRAQRIGGDSLVEAAVEVVRRHISANHLRVGETLPSEAQFADESGFSRAVVREAFRALGTLKVLDIGNGRRARVGALDGGAIATAVRHGVVTSQISLADVWDARRTIEMRTVVLASQHRNDDEALDILDLAEAIARDRENPDARIRHDMAFHEAIARAARNGLLLQIVSAFAPQMEISIPAAWRTRREQSEQDGAIADHRAIARAIADRDPDGAAQSMAQHFASSIDGILRAFDENGGAD